jgi:hypothetical protein
MQTGIFGTPINKNPDNSASLAELVQGVEKGDSTVLTITGELTAFNESDFQAINTELGLTVTEDSKETAIEPIESDVFNDGDVEPLNEAIESHNEVFGTLRRVIVKTRNDRIKLLTQQEAIALSQKASDPMFKMYAKLRSAEIALRKKIEKKYWGKAKQSVAAKVASK